MARATFETGRRATLAGSLPWATATRVDMRRALLVDERGCRAPLAPRRLRSVPSVAGGVRRSPRLSKVAHCAMAPRGRQSRPLGERMPLQAALRKWHVQSPARQPISAFTPARVGAAAAALGAAERTVPRPQVISAAGAAGSAAGSLCIALCFRCRPSLRAAALRSATVVRHCAAARLNARRSASCTTALVAPRRPRCATAARRHAVAHERSSRAARAAPRCCITDAWRRRSFVASTR